MSDNFVPDPNVSPCDDCIHRGTDKCKKCKNRKKRFFPYYPEPAIPYPNPFPFKPWTIQCGIIKEY
jgi:hypothetical protein